MGLFFTLLNNLILSQALDTEWASRKAEGAKSPTSGGAPASVSDNILDDDEEGLLEPASL